MARCSCKVKFGQFKWNRAGYAEVMNSGDVQSLVRRHAQATLASANGSFSPPRGRFGLRDAAGARNPG